MIVVSLLVQIPFLSNHDLITFPLTYFLNKSFLIKQPFDYMALVKNSHTQLFPNRISIRFLCPPISNRIGIRLLCPYTTFQTKLFLVEFTHDHSITSSLNKFSYPINSNRMCIPLGKIIPFVQNNLIYSNRIQQNSLDF